MNSICKSLNRPKAMMAAIDKAPAQRLPGKASVLLKEQQLEQAAVGGRPYE
jgi:hypothetical protein